MANKVYIVDDQGDKGETSSSRINSTNKTNSSASGSRVNPASRGAVSTGYSRTGNYDRDSRTTRTSKEETSSKKAKDEEIEALAREMLRRKEKRKSIIAVAAAVVVVLSMGAFVYMAVLSPNSTGTQKNAKLGDVFKKAQFDNTVNSQNNTGNDSVVIHYDEEKEIPDILPEFNDLLAVNSKIVGWLKMDPVVDSAKDGFPVTQTTDNEYYLDHDIYQKSDRNGTIFLDTNCDILGPSTNLILYGHHMKSGNMFGLLEKYQDESYYQNHKYIYFDTLYETGTYEVMYVFRSHVFSENEIAFKYYQFIDAYSEVEFDSYMNDMAEMSLYDTGVTAQFGDRLLTLSTCDYQEKDGRFVVVAKKIK
jgi:SrtB family sortase